MDEHVKNSNILIVEDTPTNITLLSETLRNDYQLSAVTTGEKCLQHIDKYRTDLILLDIVLPGMNGYTVISKIKNNPKTDDIPIIFISSLDESENISKGFEFGAVDYITKPFDMTVVKARIKTHLELGLYRKNLQRVIEKQSLKLTAIKGKLEDRDVSLEEANSAFRYLLKQREKEQQEVHDKIYQNLTNKIFPYIDEVKLNGSLSEKQKMYLKMMETNLKEIFSPMLVSMSYKNKDFTYMEIRIIDLLKQEMAPERIAEFFGISMEKVQFHIDDIKQKLGMEGQQTSLQTYLLTLEN